MGDDVFDCSGRLLRLAALVLAPLFWAGCGILPGSYVFDPADLEEIAGQVDATNGEDAVEQVEHLLTLRGYPIRSDPTWAINSGPGIPGQTAALYLYANEYLVVAGANSGVQWSLGPYVAVDIHDYVLYGDLTAYAADELNPPVLGQGDSVALLSGQSLSYRTTNGAWIMEYGRGILPVDLYTGAFAAPYGFVQDAVVSTGAGFITSLIRNWVYDIIGVPSNVFSMLGAFGG
jgi:hypothetical protein